MNDKYCIIRRNIRLVSGFMERYLEKLAFFAAVQEKYTRPPTYELPNFFQWFKIKILKMIFHRLFINQLVLVS